MEMKKTDELIFQSKLTFSQCLAVLKDNFETGLRMIQKTESTEEACAWLQIIAENAASLDRAIRMKASDESTRGE